VLPAISFIVSPVIDDSERFVRPAGERVFLLNSSTVALPCANNSASPRRPFSFSVQLSGVLHSDLKRLAQPRFIRRAQASFDFMFYFVRVLPKSNQTGRSVRPLSRVTNLASSHHGPCNIG